MSGARYLSDDQIAEAVRLRERGWGYASIAKRVGGSAGAIAYQCLKHGAVSPRARGAPTRYVAPTFVAWGGRTCRRFTPDDDRRLVALAADGLAIAEIAQRVGRAKTSVRIRLLQLGTRGEMAA